MISFERANIFLSEAVCTRLISFPPFEDKGAKGRFFFSLPFFHFTIYFIHFDGSSTFSRTDRFSFEIIKSYDLYHYEAWIISITKPFAQE